jgi:hypothetical protein
MDYDLEYVEKTGLSADYRQSLARYFGTLPEQARIHAFRMWLDAVGARVPQAEEAYGCFLTTLHILKRSESRHGEHEELGTRLRLWRVKGARRQKPKAKTAFIHLHFHELHDLRTNGLSWRDLETYVYEKHKIKIGFSYLRRVLAEAAQLRNL